MTTGDSPRIVLDTNVIAARLTALAALARHIEMITVVSVIDDCRDEKDNKFLALAIDSDATLIVTGDDDLLVLNAFRGVEILDVASFRARFCGGAAVG